jgi:hypothetical protein
MAADWNDFEDSVKSLLKDLVATEDDSAERDANQEFAEGLRAIFEKLIGELEVSTNVTSAISGICPYTGNQIDPTGTNVEISGTGTGSVE